MARRARVDAGCAAVAAKGSNQRDGDDARANLLGDGFSVFAASWLAQWVLVKAGALARPLAMGELGYFGLRRQSRDEAGYFERDVRELETEAGQLLPRAGGE